MKTKLVVANWKMQLPYTQALQFCANNKERFSLLAKNNPQTSLVICPSPEALFSVKATLNDASIALGAQTCSAHKNGPYTGQISAPSLAELGCTHCIIGHSERRLLCNETDNEIAQQALRLIEARIIPILCIGETKDQLNQRATFTVLGQQLEAVFAIIATHTTTPIDIIIAYEPVWSIGTGNTPTVEYLTEVFSWIQGYCTKRLPNQTFKLIYGGSVSPENVQHFASIEYIDGFLIGGASLDFQKFENIVSLIK